LYELAPELKIMLATDAEADRWIEVTSNTSNVATSDGPLGTVLGVQFAGENQSLLAGLLFQVALPA